VSGCYLCRSSPRIFAYIENENENADNVGDKMRQRQRPPKTSKQEDEDTHLFLLAGILKLRNLLEIDVWMSWIL